MKKFYILLLLSLLAVSCVTQEKPVERITHPGMYFGHHDVTEIAKGIYRSDRHKDIIVFSDTVTSFELLTPNFKTPPELVMDYDKEATRNRITLELLHSGKMELSFLCPAYRFHIPKNIKQAYVEQRGNMIYAIYLPELGVGKLAMGPDKKWIPAWILKRKSRSVSQMVFGKARITPGMTKTEVLEQIELSRSQYKTLESEKSAELYIEQPNADTISKNRWLLICPSRNCRFLGDGGGINLCLYFEEDKLILIDKLHWMGERH